MRGGREAKWEGRDPLFWSICWVVKQWGLAKKDPRMKRGRRQVTICLAEGSLTKVVVEIKTMVKLVFPPCLVKNNRGKGFG